MKREAVKRAILDLDRISLEFWRSLEGKSQNDLHKQMLHLRALREEVIISASTLLEADAVIVSAKAVADKALKEALQPDALV